MWVRRVPFEVEVEIPICPLGVGYDPEKTEMKGTDDGPIGAKRFRSGHGYPAVRTGPAAVGR